MRAYNNYTTGLSFHSSFVEPKCFYMLNAIVFKGIFVFFPLIHLGLKCFGLCDSLHRLLSGTEI